MSDQARHFYESAIPEPFTILGLRLRPLSLGHLILLNRAESAFVTGQGAVGLDDLAFAVLICSRTYEDGIAALDDPDLPIELWRWGRRLTGQAGWLGWLPWRYKPIDLKEKVGLFSSYMAEGLKCPGYYADQAKATPIDAPSYQVVKAVLLSKLNLTESEILNRPWRLCLWDFLTIRAVEGQLNFVDNDEVREAQKRAKQLFEELNTGRNNGS